MEASSPDQHIGISAATPFLLFWGNNISPRNVKDAANFMALRPPNETRLFLGDGISELRRPGRQNRGAVAHPSLSKTTRRVLGWLAKLWWISSPMDSQ